MRTIRRLYDLTKWAFTSVRGAFSITNRNFAVRDSSFIPACHVELADQALVAGTVTTATQNTGIVGLQWVRVRAILKTLGLLAAGEQVVISVQAGTGASITTPVQIAQQVKKMMSGDTAITFDFEGWSNAGFQSYAVTVQALSAAGVLDTGVTSVLDIEVDCA